VATEITVGNQKYTIYPFTALGSLDEINRLPYCLKILLENLLRHQDRWFVTQDDINALVNWDPNAEPAHEIAFVPARVLLQDFTGVPAIVDLAAMRDAMSALGGDVNKINPQVPVELVIDHSVMVDHFGSSRSFSQNTEMEVARNLERYQFLRWGQEAFDNFKVVPPGTGIVHQVNLEYLARGVFTKETDAEIVAYPDSLVGTDSHTTMINGLGVLGWGVGGIEAEAAMLGQPITMLIPQVVGFKLEGQLKEGATATDLVLTVTQLLRAHGVVGKFVEFHGPGLKHLSLADRATIANMAPEYGATCGIFPVDAETVNYMRLTGRPDSQLELIQIYMQAMQLWHDEKTPDAEYSSMVNLDLGDVVPSVAGPTRPQDRIAITDTKVAFEATLQEFKELSLALDQANRSGSVDPTFPGQEFSLDHGAVVIAAITSCTNTSNPAVLVAAGLLAKKARELGLVTKPWVKTSLAPGSKTVTDYLHKAGLLSELEAFGFYLVGYGCTTCIGNSGPLPAEISSAIKSGNLLACSVLSGNRNFEGRIHAEVRANYLASPPLVVAYAIAGNMNIDLSRDALGHDRQGNPVKLSDIWPSAAEIQAVINANVDPALFREKYADVYSGNETWNKLTVPDSAIFDWPESTYVKQPSFFTDITLEVPRIQSIENARCLVLLGDSITTDHVSPAGNIEPASPAGVYLQARQIEPADFNSYGSRRGNHEVMMRGTFANVRLRNELAPGTEGSWTTHYPSGNKQSIFDAAMSYADQGVPLIVIAGKEYGTGSSRDWAAKGPALLGVKVVIAAGFERIHRSNLIGMGILPLQFEPGENAASLGITGAEEFTIRAVNADQRMVEVAVKRPDSTHYFFKTDIRIDTHNEFAYYQHGGILHYVLRQLAA